MNRSDHPGFPEIEENLSLPPSKKVFLEPKMGASLMKNSADIRTTDLCNHIGNLRLQHLH